MCKEYCQIWLYILLDIFYSSSQSQSNYFFLFSARETSIIIRNVKNVGKLYKSVNCGWFLI